MHPSVQLTLRGIDACRRYLDSHPGQPVVAVNGRFDFAEVSATVHEARRRQPLTRWIELRPHSAGIAIRVVDGPDSALAESVLYPATPVPVDGLWLGLDPEAITAPPFLSSLTAAAGRALRKLDVFSEILHA